MPRSVTIAPDASDDLAAVINAALQDPNIDTVVLEPGVFLLSSSIIVPSNKTLTGSGQGETIVRAAADFDIIGPSDNAVIVTERFASKVSISDLTVDAGKILPEGFRLNGVFLKFATDFNVSRVDAGNATGYAFFAQGDPESYAAGRTPIEASGSFTNCNSFNSQVHFEQMASNGVILTNCNASDGDGDIPTEAYFHILVGSSNISYIDCNASGKGFLGFSIISSVKASENILIENCNIEILNPSTGSALIALGNLPINALIVVDSSFISENYIGFRIGGVTGTAENSYFQGRILAIEATTSGNGTPSNFVATNSTALGLGDPATSIGVASVHADGPDFLIWNGGTLEARAKLMFPVSGSPTVSPTTLVVIDGFDTIVQFNQYGPLIDVFPELNFQIGAEHDVAGSILRVAFVAFGDTNDQLGFTNSALLTISGQYIFHADELVATFEGGLEGNDLVVSFNALATPHAVQAIVQAINFFNNAELPVTKARHMVATLELADGYKDELTSSITVVAYDDPPVLDLTGGDPFPEPNFVEGSEAIVLAPNGTVKDIDSTSLSGGKFIIAISEGYVDGDKLVVTTTSDVGLANDVIYYRGIGAATVIVDGTSGLLEIQLNSGTSVEAAQALLRAIGFVSGSDDPGDAPRLVSFHLSNGVTQTDVIPVMTVAVAPIDDPAVAVDDNASITENQTVIIDVLKNEIDPDARLDHVVSVAGLAIAEGELVTLPSGATVSLNADGTLSYDPRGQFNYLAAPDSGSILTSAVDSFSYSLTSGSTAMATVTIFGLASTGDIIRGTSASDVLRATQAGQFLEGMAGNDQLSDNGYKTLMAGGVGNDTYIVSNSGTTLSEAAVAGTDTVVTNLLTFTLSAEFENLSFTGGLGRFTGYGNAKDNVIIGGDEADFLTGYAGDDTLRAGAGNDVLNGGVGFDILDGGLGADAMLGGLSNDVYYVDNINDRVIEFSGGGWDQVFVSLPRYQLPEDVENLMGMGPWAFELVGNTLGNQMLGGNMNDLLSGLGGNDYLFGFAGDDRLYGDEGDDTLIGGFGNDILTGGAGKDAFRFDLVFHANNVDYITDFESGSDRISLAQSVFSALSIGSLSPDQFVEGISAIGVDSRIIYDPETGAIYYDPDGSGPAQQQLFATLSPNSALNHNDFVIG